MSVNRTWHITCCTDVIGIKRFSLRGKQKVDEKIVINDEVAQHHEVSSICMGMSVEGRRTDTTPKKRRCSITWNSRRQYGKSMKEKQQIVASVVSYSFEWVFLQLR
jgi:hypothetical protein